jgi:hypothetical protein
MGDDNVTETIAQIRRRFGVTRPMLYALQTAARRPRLTMCPVLTSPGRRINGEAETALLSALERRGMIDYVGPIPVINAAGLEVVDAAIDVLPRTPAT